MRMLVRAKAWRSLRVRAVGIGLGLDEQHWPDSEQHNHHLIKHGSAGIEPIEQHRMDRWHERKRV